MIFGNEGFHQNTTKVEDWGLQENHNGNPIGLNYEYSGLLESQDRLDVSILNINKYLTSDKRKDSFLYNHCIITQKVDGIKVSIIKTKNTGDNLKDFTVAYKNKIIYPNEFNYAGIQKIKLNSINNSQFKILFEHLKKYDLSQIPIGIEFFVEFACKKPTLSSNYTKHGFVLLAYCKTPFKVKNGILRTSPNSFNTELIEKYAKIFRFNIPVVLFDGILAMFERGIKSKDLRSEFLKIQNSLDIKNPDTYIQKISDLFLTLDSPFGGKEEGVILTYDDGLRLKIQQSYQTDETKRAEIKMKYKEDNIEDETSYWDRIRSQCLELLNHLPQAKETTLDGVLEILSKKLKLLKHNIQHSKKSELQILDDIQTYTKDLIIRKMKGNNGALFLGKFRILTNAHYDIILQGIKNYDTMTVCLVSNKETKSYDSLRLEMLKLAFGNQIEIIQHSSGYIIGIINKSKNNINAVLCGTDRYADYCRQLQNNPDVNVVEVPRTDEDISASKVIENLDNYAYFCLKTPKQIHKLYKEIKNVFQ